ATFNLNRTRFRGSQAARWQAWPAVGTLLFSGLSSIYLDKSIHGEIHLICRQMHALSRKPIHIKDLKQILRPQGFTPIFSLIRKMASEQLTPFNIATPDL